MSKGKNEGSSNLAGHVGAGINSTLWEFPLQTVSNVD
jgi:hypothetical protein